LNDAVCGYWLVVNFIYDKEVPRKVNGAPKNEGQPNSSNPFLKEYSDGLGEFTWLKQKGTCQKQEKWHSQPPDALVNGYRIPSDYFKPTHLLAG
jgi:hypothetical protein